jgi:hypothetical protein
LPHGHFSLIPYVPIVRLGEYVYYYIFTLQHQSFLAGSSGRLPVLDRTSFSIGPRVKFLSSYNSFQVFLFDFDLFICSVYLKSFLAHFLQMSRLLYGSSNVYRHFNGSTLGTELGLSLVECTKKTVFDAHVATLGTLGTGSLIVTSVLENFVCDVCTGLSLAEVSLFACQTITTHVEALAAIVRDSPDSSAFVSPLLCRRVPGALRFKKIKLH